MARSKQLSFLKDPRRRSKLWWIVKQGVYGGSLNYRKVRRPFDKKKMTHAVFKADLGRAMGFHKFERNIFRILKNSAHCYGIRLRSEDIAIHPDHLHVVFYTKTREAQLRFLRLVSAEIGRKYYVLRKKLGHARKPLWRHRPFTRLVSFGRRSLSSLRNYVLRNRLETLGFIAYQPRQHRLNQFLDQWEMSLSTA